MLWVWNGGLKFSSLPGDISSLSIFSGHGGLLPLLLLLEVELDGGVISFSGGTGADGYSLLLWDIVPWTRWSCELSEWSNLWLGEINHCLWCVNGFFWSRSLHSGNWDSLNFTSQEIMMHWFFASQNCHPFDKFSLSNQQVRSADYLGMQSVIACNNTCIKGQLGQRARETCARITR